MNKQKFKNRNALIQGGNLIVLKQEELEIV